MGASQTNITNREGILTGVRNHPKIQECVRLFENLWNLLQQIFAESKNRKVTIQLYCAQETVMTDYVMQELAKMLKSQKVHDRLSLSVEIRKEISNIERNMPLIVICLSCSRLSVDLRRAISGVPTGSNTVVLIFHHLKEHALPTESSHTILTKDEVSNVGIIIDVAFVEKMGMYKCDMNKKAYKTLIAFIEDNWTE